MNLLLTTVGTALATLLCLLAGLVYRKAAANKPIPGLPLAPDAHWLWGHGKLYMDYCDMSIRYIKSLGPFVCMYHPITGPALLSASAEVVCGLFKDRCVCRASLVLLRHWAAAARSSFGQGPSLVPLLGTQQHVMASSAKTAAQGLWLDAGYPAQLNTALHQQGN